MTLVAGVDSSTQSVKVVVCDAGTGAVVRSASAPHPHGTEVEPEAWWQALQAAIAAAGGIDRRGRDLGRRAAARHGVPGRRRRCRPRRPALERHPVRASRRPT